MTRFRRPVALTTQVAGPEYADEVPGRRAELAEELASALLSVGRRDPAAALARADELGLVGLAEAWRGADAISTAGLLWALHLLRSWCTFRGREAARLYRDGRVLVPVEDAVAGVPDAPLAADLAGVGEALLLTAYAGELGAAAERAAALLRVVALGRCEAAQALPAAAATVEHRQAARASATAERFAEVARAWRAGHLH